MTWLVGAAVACVVLVLGAPRPRIHAASSAPPAWPVLIGAAGLAALVVPPALALAVVVVLVGGRAWWRVRERHRTARATAGEVLEACEQLVAEVAAGQPPARALDHAARAWPPLADAAGAAELGSSVPAALRRLAARPGAGDLRLVAAAWEVAHRSGGGLADGLARVAATLRDDRATALVVEGELASARATARLVAALPVVVLVLGGGAEGGGWRFLLGTPLGAACLLLGLALGLLGLWWIERIAVGVARG